MTNAGSELLTRDATTATFVRLLGDPNKSLTIRARAAEALGRAPGSASRKALVSALGSGHVRIAHKAAEALGRVGLAVNRRDLMPSETDGTQTRRMLAFARSMISYRLGLGTDLLVAPAEVPGFTTSRARSVDVTPIRSEKVAHAIEATTAAPVRLSARGALRVRCDGVEVIVALAHSLPQDGRFQSALEVNQVVGCVLEPSTGNMDLVSDLYLFTHPAGVDSVEIFGVRRTGVVALYGVGTVNQDVLSFEVRSVANERSARFLFVGRHQADAPRLGFSQAFVAGPVAAARSSASDALTVW